MTAFHLAELVESATVTGEATVRARKECWKRISRWIRGENKAARLDWSKIHGQRYGEARGGQRQPSP